MKNKNLASNNDLLEPKIQSNMRLKNTLPLLLFLFPNFKKHPFKFILPTFSHPIQLRFLITSEISLRNSHIKYQILIIHKQINHLLKINRLIPIGRYFYLLVLTQ